VVITAHGSSGSAPPGASGRAHRTAWGLVGLELVGQVRQSHRFHARVVVAAIGLASLTGTGRVEPGRLAGAPVGLE
jgi:hypothetical protein